MPSRKSVDSFVSLVELGKFDLAIELYYAADLSGLENADPPRVSIAALAQDEGCVESSPVRAKSVGPVLIEGDHVVIRWQFEFHDEGGGRRTLDEIAYQRWEGEHVAEERFYYDPDQMRA